MKIVALLKGTIAACGIKKPEQGQKFDPHWLITLLQIDGMEAETVKIKCHDLTRKFEEGKSAEILCQVRDWKMGNNSGLSVRAI